MKKKVILVSIISLLIISIIIVKQFFHDDNNFVQDGVILAVTVDGKSVTDFPERGRYEVKVDCTNATGKWLSEEWKLALEDIKDPVNCSIDFTTVTETFANYVEKDQGVSHETIGPVDLKSSDYSSNKSTFYNTSYSSTSGTTNSTVFSFNTTNSLWSTKTSAMSTGKYYHLKFNIPSNGYYQFCYNIPKGTSLNKLYLYTNTVQTKTISASSTAVQSDCLDLGARTTSDYIMIVQGTSTSSMSTSQLVSMEFKLKSSPSVDPLEAGYRYTGGSPNNYVWFNDELWRIIGSIPTKTSTGTKNLVKIIRNEPIPGIVYHTSNPSTTAWGSNTLYNILNNNYYSTSESNFNAQDVIGCNTNKNTTKSKCDYSGIGILSTSFFGKMVENVYWNTGGSDYTTDPTTNYLLETSNQTISGKVGLLSTSDYSYADKEANWLNKYDFITLIHGYQKEVANGLVTVNSSSSNSGIILPVVYLNENVYVVSGDGTEANPYQIAI